MSPTLVDLLHRGPAPSLVDGGLALGGEALRGAVMDVAERLVGAGVRPGDAVGLLSGRSGGAVVALHGILAAGACVVPLDPFEAPHRLATIIEDARLQVILTGTMPPARKRALAGAAAELPPMLPLDGGSGPKSAAPAVRPDDLALVLYTSGSTGKPKGVELTHRAVAAFATWAAEALDLQLHDRVAHLSPLGFDLCTFELFAAAHVGAATWVAGPALTMAPTALATALDEAEVTVLYTVPSVWQRLAGALPEHGGLPALRWLLTAGEAFPPAALARLMGQLPQVQVANLFGPTETNVCCWHRVERPPEGPIPIGQPASGATLRIVSEDDKSPGELWVRGPSIMRGYRGRPEENRQVFVDDAEGRWLRTGDRVWRDASGVLHFAGRLDTQIKRSGFRIQPEEVEAACGAIPGVAAARIVWTGEHLIAELERDPSEPETDDRAAWRVLRRWLSTAMLPDRLEWVSELPRSARGKLTRTYRRRAEEV